MDLPGTTLWWTQNQPQQTMLLVEPIHHPQTQWFNSQTYPNTPHFNANNQNDNDEENEDEDNTVVKLIQDEKEPMFEKPLTPSDVGKLNRLVIPKQHAEKYFPLEGGDSGECKGLLLSFEDESGKCWRFRYSYWNSSQSYVLTKGWSRYVKDKRLDAGDVVLFERHRVDSQRLFINWRRRKLSGNESAQVSRGKGSDGNGNRKNEVGGGVGVGWSRGFYPAHPYPTHQLLPYQHDHCLHAGSGSPQGQNRRTKPVGNNSSSSSSSSRVLRLFGVDMECQPEHDSTPQCSSYDSNNMPSTQGTDHTQHLYHYRQPSSHNSNSNSHPHVVRHQPYYY